MKFEESEEKKLNIIVLESFTHLVNLLLIMKKKDLRVNQASTLIILFEKFLNMKWIKFGSLLGTKNWQTKEKVKKQKEC